MKSREIYNPSTGITQPTFHSNELHDLQNTFQLGEAQIQDLDNNPVIGLIQIGENLEFAEEEDSFGMNPKHSTLHFVEEPQPNVEAHSGQYIFGQRQESSMHSESQSQEPEEKPHKRLEKGQMKDKSFFKVEAEENFYQKFKKNVNMPKAIGRYLMNYYHHFKGTLFQNERMFFQQLATELEDRKAWVRRSKKNSIKLRDLECYFGLKMRTPRQSCLTRLMMRKIIHKWSRKEILPNNQVKDKLEYLVAAKVFSLRCSNSGLATRMQMR